MSDDLNPYAQWLGLAASVTAPNHYQLLGLDESVTDPAVVASAADRAMTQVRACKPGAHAAAWAQLLDQISAAKTTLTDPAQRQAYDRQRKTPAVPVSAPASAAPINPNLLPPTPAAGQSTLAPQPTGAAIDPMAPVAPVVMSPQPATAQVAQPSQAAAVPQAFPYLQPATTAPEAPNPMAPVASAVPMSPVAPNAPQSPPNPMAPVAQAAPVARSPMAPMQPAAMPTAAPVSIQAAPITAPQAAPAAGPMLASPSVASVHPTPRLKRKPTITARAHSKSGGLFVPIVLGGGVGGLILVVAAVGFWFAASKPAPRSVAAGATAPGRVNHGAVTSTFPRRLDEIPESERPKPELFTLPTPTSPSAELPPPNMAPEPEMEMEPKMQPVPSPQPSPATPEPMPEREPTRDELRTLAQSLTTARIAIGELNFLVADREIAKALAVARLDKHKAKITRLQLLSDYVGRFRAAISETLSRLEGGEEIRFENGLVISIIEAAEDRLLIRLSGQKKEYTIPSMPLGLSRRLAEMSLDNEAPETTAMKAAFVSVNPKIGDSDLEKARVWWEEAAGVADVPDLITAINDDYSLRQEILAGSLDPDALTELTARADRLKDARTIEAFAAEYQAVIDESLKTLEPEMELTVGGSTTITIQELKQDRVMLTVAGETRGFRYTKLPLGLAGSIAERVLPRDAPLSMVMKGAYYAAREKDQPNKQFRSVVLGLWKQAGEMDPQLQAVIRQLVTQYPE